MVKKVINNTAEKTATNSTLANMADTFAQSQAISTPDKASKNYAKQTRAAAKTAQQKAKVAKAVNSKKAQYPVSFGTNVLHEKVNNELQDKVKPIPNNKK